MESSMNQTIIPHNLEYLAEADQGAANLITAGLSGVALHILIFSRGEWDIAAPKIPLALLGAQIVVYLFLLFSDPQASVWSALWGVTKISSCLVAGVGTSILVYRAFFHRLNRFPGPFGARLSMGYIAAMFMKHPDAFNYIQNLHQEHGDFVRIGPTELSINHPEALNAVHSGQSQCTKGPWYSMLHPFISLFAIRDKSEHSRRRKPWELAFRPKAVQAYLPSLEKCTADLLKQIERQKGAPVDMTMWINLFMFDLTGLVAFSQEYNCVRDGKKHAIMEVNDSSNVISSIVSQIVWAISFVKVIPGLNANMKLLIDFSKQQVRNREKMQKSDHSDVFSWLWDDFKIEGRDTPQSRLDLVADASLVIFAGSGTVAVTIIGVLYFLASESPHHLETIQRELNSLDEINSHTLTKLVHLNAVINETLRLHYPALSGFQRQTPSHGIHIGKTYIPGGINIKIPFYTLFRDERNFEQPETFIPERWSTQSHLVRNREAFAPFLLGPYNCLGKSLALMQVRHVIVELIRRYDFCLAPEQNAKEYWAARTDGFVMGLGPLQLVFTDRKDPDSDVTEP